MNPEVEQALRSLSAEICEAAGAIAANSLGALEESLWRQHILCAKLKYLLSRPSLNDPEGSLPSANHEVVRSLSGSTAMYEQVIQQAQEANHLLHRLCLSYSASSITGAPQGHVLHKEGWSSCMA